MTLLLADRDVRMNSTTTIDYDGMVRCDVSLFSMRGVDVEALHFVLPVKPQFATLRTWWPVRFGGLDNAGDLPRGGEKLPFKPYYWLGNEDIGIAWFSECDRDWYPRYPNEALEVTQSAKRTSLVLHLVDRALTLTPNPQLGISTDTLRYTFGIQATPVKPFPRDWHAWHISHGAFFGMETQTAARGKTVLDVAAEAGVKTVIYHETWTDVQNYPRTTHQDELKHLIDACHRKGIKVLLYFGYEMSTIAPEWKELSGRLLVRPRIKGYTRVNPEQTGYFVCYRSNYANMLTEGIEHLVKDFDIDGVYLDSSVMPWGCTNTDHGCGYVSLQGTVKPTYPIFAVRDFLRRVYTICTRKPGGMVNVHASSCTLVPALSWATSYWDGEQLVVDADRYTTSHLAEIMSPDVFRAEAMGRNIGVPGEFLVYAEPKPFTRLHGLAYALLHDVPLRPWGIGPYLQEVAPVWNAWKAFDVDNAVLYPYWKPNPFIVTDSGDVKVTCHRHERNGLLVVAVNLGKKAQTATVRVDLNLLHISPTKAVVTDAYRDEPMGIRNGVIVFPLDPMAMRMFWIR